MTAGFLERLRGRAFAPGLFAAAVLAATAFAMLAYLVLRHVVHVPDIVETARGLGLYGAERGSIVKPEPVENLLFMVTVVVATLLATFAAWTSARFDPAQQPTMAPSWSWAALAAAIVGALAAAWWLTKIDWATMLPPAPSGLIVAARSEPGTLLLWGAVAAAAAAAITFVRHLPLQRSLSVLLASVAIVLLGRMTLLGVGDNYTETTHYEVFSYPIIQDWLGQGVAVGADGQKSQYGMYSIFLRPLWELLGGPSTPAISATMSVLTILSSVAPIAFVSRFAAHSMLGAMIGLSSILVAQLLYPFWPGDAYFEFFPVRLVFPALAMALLCWAPTRERWRLASLTLLATGLIWNFESGIVGLAIYVTFTTAVAFKPDWLATTTLLARQGLMCAVAVAIAALLLVAHHLVRFNALPDVATMLLSIKAFSAGLGAEPMPLNGAWAVHALVYALAIFVGMRSLFQGSTGDRRLRDAALLTLSVAGVIWLRYYQGRSLPLPLCFVTGPAICCIGLMADRALSGLRNDRLAAVSVTAVVAFFALGSAVTYAASNPFPGRSVKVLGRDNPGSTVLQAVARLTDTFDAIRQTPQDRLFVVAPYAGLVNLELGHAGPVKTAGMCQLWFQTELDEAVAAMAAPETKMVAFDSGTPSCLISLIDEKELVAVLDRDYEPLDVSDGCTVASASRMSIFVRRGYAPGDRENLGKRGVATQISTYGDASAGRAIDDDKCGLFEKGSTSHTSAHLDPWWEVDLGAVKDIDAVDIWNRSDCCSDRLANFWVFASERPFAESDTSDALRQRQDVAAKFVPAQPSPSAMVRLPAKARYVRVQLQGEGYLSLAEVRVLGAPSAAASPTREP